jgi:hypothetical protein
MNFVFVCPEAEDLKCSVDKRCAAPARAINQTGRYNADLIGWRDFVSNSPDVSDLLENSDYIIIHRGLWSPLLSRIQHWKARDKTMIADFTEAYQLMSDEELSDTFDLEVNGGLQAGDMGDKSTPYLTQLKWTLQSMHGATTPSQRLCDDWNPYTRSLVLPDYIDLDRLNLIIPQEHQGVTFGWRGTVRQLFNMKKSGVLMALEAMLQMRPNARILFSIDHPEAMGSLNLPGNQVEIIGWSDKGGWYRQLSNIDIGLFPRIGEMEQRGDCSSMLEFMALKIPWIASQGPAVYDFQSYGWIVENTPESWLKAAVETVDYLDDYRAEARVAPYLYAISKSLEENVQTIVDTYVRLGSLYSTRPLTPSQQKSSGRLIMAEDQGLDG